MTLRAVHATLPLENVLARPPNYRQQKKQREQAKANKNEQKRLRRVRPALTEEQPSDVRESDPRTEKV